MSLTIPTHSPATGAMPHAEAHKVSSFWTLTLGSIGVVYGDIGTSPLYALKESLAAATGHAGHSALTEAMVFGVVSLILWALILIVTVKYVVLVLRADNNGEGGILSLITLAHSSGCGIRPDDVFARARMRCVAQRTSCAPSTVWKAVTAPARHASIISRIRMARASTANGFVIISIPGSRKPFAMVAFSA